MKKIETNVLIMGAGPAGAVTAMFLAKHNIPSLLIDKAIFPRDKICGDALSGKVVEVLKKLNPEILERLSKNSHQLGSWGVKFIAPNFKSLDVPFRTKANGHPHAPGFLSTRLNFDKFLIDEVKKSKKINFIEGTELNQFKKTNEGWLVTDKKNELEICARLIVAADGAHSYFARHIAKIEQQPEHYCAGIRAYYNGVTDLHPENFIELHFLKNFLPGYLWIFPLPNGMANVGVGMRSDIVSSKKINLKKEMLSLIESDPSLKKRFANATLIGDIKGYGLPLGSKKRKISGDNFLLTGDAASLIDPFTGEGIGNAMISGMIASKVIVQAIEENNFSEYFLSQYDQQIYHRLWSELKLSKRMQELVNFPWLFNMVVNKAGRSKLLRDTISCMFEDINMRQQLRNPLFYGRLLFTNA